MTDENKEKEFFSYLQKQFPKNNYIKLDSKFIPNKTSNNLNRFYDSIWFSRLKLPDNNNIYYFGLISEDNDLISPKIILKFNKELSKSTIRFSKDHVLLLIKLFKDSNYFNLLNNNLKIVYATKNKSSGLFYIDIGKIGSQKLINNIRFLINTFDFDLNINKPALIISNLNNDFSDFTQKNNSDGLLEILKFNLKVIEIKDIIYKLDFDRDTLKWIDEYLFTVNEKKDYSFNKSFDKPDNEIFIILKNSLSNLDSNLDYKSILNKINNDLNI